jgi:hypothetical protein
MHGILLVTHPKGVALFEKRQYPRNKHLFRALFHLLKCDDLHISVCIFLRPLFSIGRKKRLIPVAALLLGQITYKEIGLHNKQSSCVFNRDRKNVRSVVNTHRDFVKMSIQMCK